MRVREEEASRAARRPRADRDHALRVALRPGVADGRNRLDITEPGCTRGGDCSFSGRTRTHKDRSGAIVEFDVVFNERVRWSFLEPATWDGSDRRTSFKNVMLHEVGHGIGFPHSAGATPDLSIMGSLMGKWLGAMRTGLKAFDHGHVRHHYGAPGANPPPDLVLSNYRTRAKGSQHACVLHAKPEPALAVPGGMVTVGFTEMNLGGAAAGARYEIGLYLSRDPRIDARDLKIASLPGQLKDAATTRYRSVTVALPHDLAPGIYCLGVIADAGGDLDEAREDNNVLLVPSPIAVRYVPFGS